MMKHIAFLSLFMLFFSCGNEDKVPENIIPKEEFINLLVDIQLMEAYCQNKYVRPDIYKELLHDSVDSLLKANDRSIEEYEESFDYYSMQPDVMFQIYEQVLVKINDLQVTENAVKVQKSE